MKIQQNISAKTSLGTTAAVHQALAMLQMNNLELGEFLQQEAMQNPFLMVEIPQSSPIPDSLSVKSSEWEQDYYGKGFWGDDDEESSPFNKVKTPDSILESLRSQIECSFLKKEDLVLAKALIPLLDSRGFLKITPEAIAKKTKRPVDEITRIIETLKTFEPIGIFCKNWKESALLQIEEMGEDTKIFSILLDNLKSILEGKIHSLLKKHNLTQAELYAKLKIIRSLNTSPLSVCNEDPQQTRIPDIIAEKDSEGEWRVFLNETILPKALADKNYYSQTKEHVKGADEKSFIRDSYQKASWICKTLQQRYMNIQNIAKSIVGRQKAFLESGTQMIVPMTLRDIASDLGIHESTVSRGIRHRFIQTPHGIFSLKFLFNQQLSGSFQDHASVVVKEKIKKIIEGETKPLSDEDLAVMLQKLGIDIARRTVTKYRESLSIPTSRERKRINKIKSF